MSEVPNSPVPRAWISSATFSDRTNLRFVGDEIILFVGPNNSGKSRSLRDLSMLFSSSNHAGIVVKAMQVAPVGTGEDLVTWLKQNIFSPNPESPNSMFQGMGVHCSVDQAKYSWSNFQDGLGPVAACFCHLLSTEARLSAANPPPNIPLLKQGPSHPIHAILRDDRLESLISGFFKQAFDQDLIVNRNAGNEVPIHCGKKPIFLPGEDRISRSYLDQLERLPTLHTQGDGMRGFVGVLLHSLIAKHSVVLIDEPEAFLHPPQARLLGKMLAKEVPENRQFFIATHSGDFLRGILDANTKNVRIVRLQREGEVNNVRELASRDIQNLWSDSLLRYSNVLDGLFHEKVVVCEGDADCRFYGAVLDAIYETKPDKVRPDIMFIHCGGKARVSSVTRALKALGVPTACVVDFDVFNDENPLREIIESLGGEWAKVAQDWKTFKTAIESKKPDLDASEVRREIQQVLESSKNDGYFSKVASQQIQKILRRSSPWSHAKDMGKTFVPSGGATQACERVLKECRKFGVFVVELGELEAFAKSVGGHGPTWVNSVLTKNLETETELATAREFVSALAAFGEKTPPEHATVSTEAPAIAEQIRSTETR